MIEITEATSQDLPLIRQLAEQTFHVTYLPLQPKEKVDYLFDLMYNPASLAEQMKNGQRFILAKDETGYQGYASYEINCKKIGLTKIHKIYVLPTAQGKGVGKKLINAIAKLALKNKNQALSLNVYRKNPAIEFYEKLGFEKVDEVDIDVGNGFTMNDYVMEKILS
jgi:ribosomal protein S18 acetylase RimI-like enzyme